MVEAIREGDIPGVQLRCRQELALPASEMWSWLREPARMERWLAASASLGEENGSEQLLLEGEEEGRSFREMGESRAVEPQRRWQLAFQRLGENWGAATDLTFDLTENANGCELSVLQHGFQRLPLSECLTIWEAYRRRWRSALGRLSDAVQPS